MTQIFKDLSPKRRALRIGLLILALVLLTASIGVSAKYASNKPAFKGHLILPSSAPVIFTVGPENAAAAAGEDVTVNIGLSGTYEAHSMQLRLSYDTDMLELDLNDVAKGSALNEIINLGGFTSITENSKHEVIIQAISPNQSFSVEGDIVSVKFRVKDTAPTGDAKVKLTVDELKFVPLDSTTASEQVDVENEVDPEEFTISVIASETDEPGNTAKAAITPEPTEEPEEPEAEDTEEPTEPEDPDESAGPSEPSGDPDDSVPPEITTDQPIPDSPSFGG